MAGHAQLKLIMTECSKTQIRLTGLICMLLHFMVVNVAQNLQSVLDITMCYALKIIRIFHGYEVQIEKSVRGV